MLRRPTPPPPLPPSGAVPRPIAALDRWLNRIYGSRFNPVYQSGTVVVLLLLVLLITGLWLLFFYRVGSPWDSVSRLTDDRWLGNWVRGVHRYASDAAVVATAVHALRMFFQRRTWGPRTLAWVTGLVLFGVVFVAGWTGFVMVWDGFGYRLAIEGARLLDVLPLFSEPIRRTFVGDRPVPNAFFFLNLFLHVALPLGMGVGLWLHVSRLARPVLLPPRRLSLALIALLIGLAVFLPLGMSPEADPFRVPVGLVVDWFYAFWLPLAAVTPPGLAWAVIIAMGIGLLAIPRGTRPVSDRRREPSRVDSQLCTGCRQCALDCPFEAITMVPRTDGRADVIAKVDPARCVSCGICAGSCAPMGIGPPGFTGRDQVATIRASVGEDRVAGRVVMFVCEHASAQTALALVHDDVTVLPVPCVGNLHTSAIELAVRGGALGAVVLSCPPRDCWSREGPRWLEERIHHDREAELKARVDRRRVFTASISARDESGLRALVDGIQRQVRQLEAPPAEAGVDLEDACQTTADPPEGEGER